MGVRCFLRPRDSSKVPREMEKRGRGVIAGRRGLAVSQGPWGSGWGVMVAHGWRTIVLGSE